MSVHQVEEYYVHMSGLKITEDQKKEIEEHLSDEGYANYEFQDNDTCLVIDDVQDECSGDTLEQFIRDIIE